VHTPTQQQQQQQQQQQEAVAATATCAGRVLTARRNMVVLGLDVLFLCSFCALFRFVQVGCCPLHMLV